MRAIFGLTAFAVLLPLVMAQGDGPSQQPANESITAHDFPWAVFAVSPLLQSPVVDFADWQRHRPEIKKLIADLGARDFKARDSATKRLTSIGVPALAALQQAGEEGDLETQQPARLLVSAIRQANFLLTIVDGIEFKPIVDGEWLIPEGDEQTEINIALQITNTERGAVQMHLLDSIFFGVIVPDGRYFPVPWTGRRFTKAGPTNSPPLARKEGTMLTFKAYLKNGKDSVHFHCQDQFLNRWEIWGLYEGKYKLAVSYRNDKPNPDNGPPCWVGKAQCDVPVLIRQQSKKV
jgi:hypothetical protein